MAPLLVAQRAKNFEHALALCNGVRHGLAAALFSESRERQEQFLEEARAGVLKFNTSTAGVDSSAWRLSVSWQWCGFGFRTPLMKLTTRRQTPGWWFGPLSGQRSGWRRDIWLCSAPVIDDGIPLSTILPRTRRPAGR